MNKFNTLGTRFVLLFCAITIPLLLILFLVGSYAKSVVLSQVAHSYQNLVDSNVGMIDRSLDDIAKNMVDIVNHDDNFQKLGQPGLSDSDLYFSQIELIHRNTTYQNYYHTADMFFIYSKPNDKLFSTDMFGAASGMKEEVRAWIDDSFQHQDQIKRLMYKWSIVRIGDRYFLYRLISNDITNNAYIGAIISIDSLIAPLGDLDLKQAGNVLFVDDSGTVLSTPTGNLGAIHRLPADKLQTNGSFTYASSGVKSKLLVVQSRSSMAGILMAVILPNTALLSGLSDFQIVINLLPLVAVAILLVYMFIFRNMVFKPISQLLRAIRRIKEGDMAARLSDASILEFATINHSFNRMIEEITDLKIDVYEGRLRSQKAEMKQLQLQINPHFFLNTLNIIFQLADLNRSELVKKTVRHMVQYFRFMMNTKSDVITLGREFEHIGNYLEIQKMRYQDDFIYDITLDERLRETAIPSLLVQPFVENAMLHGLSLKPSPFHLALKAERWKTDPDKMCIELCDNGKGIPPEQLLELNADQYSPVSEGSHIGIWNVKRRLAMRYGVEASLELESLASGGVRVRLVIPIEPWTEGAGGS